MTQMQLTFEDVEMWAEYAAHPIKFKNAHAQALKCMKSPRKVTEQHIADFNERYKIVWYSDDSILVENK